MEMFPVDIYFICCILCTGQGNVEVSASALKNLSKKNNQMSYGSPRSIH